jgi:protoheme ferro-lyase
MREGGDLYVKQTKESSKLIMEKIKKKKLLSIPRNFKP